MSRTITHQKAWGALVFDELGADAKQCGDRPSLSLPRGQQHCAQFDVRRLHAPADEADTPSRRTQQDGPAMRARRGPVHGREQGVGAAQAGTPVEGRTDTGHQG